MRWIAVALLSLGASLSGSARADEDTAAADPSAMLRDASALREAGDIDAAIERLKAAYERLPNDEQIVIALAQAYLDDDNQVWAIRTLARHLDYEAGACNARALLAWIYVTTGMTEMAEDVLAFDGCREPPAVRTRWLLIRAFAAHLADDADRVRDLIGQARRQGAIYAEDEALLATLTGIYEPGRVPAAVGHVEFGAGWTSNGLAGSPVDQSSTTDAASALLELDARLRATWPSRGLVQAVAEGRLRATELASAVAHDLSYRTVTGRAGVRVGKLPQLELLYAGELTQIAADDRYQSGPLWFSEAHRLEYQLDISRASLLFGAAGHRDFRELGRSRWEIEQGIAWAVSTRSNTGVLGGISARYNEARNRAYDRSGATIVLEIQHPLPHRFELRAGGSASVDAYPHSAGYFMEGNRTRSDEELRLRGGIWAHLSSAMMTGLTYELTNRSSSATDYAFTDHRILLRVRGSSDSDRLRRRVVPIAGRSPLELGSTDETAGVDASDVRELIERDESVRRGSTCLK